MRDAAAPSGVQGADWLTGEGRSCQRVSPVVRIHSFPTLPIYSSSVGESILLETGTNDYLLQEEYIIGTGGANTGSLDNTAQNELFESLDDDVLDFTESNPFGDAGE